MNALLTSMGLALALTGCGALDFSRQVPVNHPEVTTERGVVLRDLLSGQGLPAIAGDEVTVDYTVQLEDGTQVDSTLDRGLTETFRLGAAPLPGWDEGLIGMRPGGRRWLLLPPGLAYGEAGVPGLVPPGAALECVVELHSIHGQDR